MFGRIFGNYYIAKKSFSAEESKGYSILAESRWQVETGRGDDRSTFGAAGEEPEGAPFTAHEERLGKPGNLGGTAERIRPICVVHMGWIIFLYQTIFNEKGLNKEDKKC